MWLITHPVSFLSVNVDLTIGQMIERCKNQDPDYDIDCSMNLDLFILCWMKNVSHEQAKQIAVTSVPPRGKWREGWQVVLAVVGVPCSLVKCKHDHHTEEASKQCCSPHDAHMGLEPPKLGPPQGIDHQGGCQKPLHVKCQVPGLSQAAIRSGSGFIFWYKLECVKI